MQLVRHSKKTETAKTAGAGLFAYLCEICRTPHNRGHFFSVALECHGGLLGVRNLQCNIFNMNEWNTQIILLAKTKHRTYLPDICVIVAWTTSQELVIWANSGFYIEWGVLVTIENWHCGGTCGEAAWLWYVKNQRHKECSYKMPKQDVKCQGNPIIFSYYENFMIQSGYLTSSASVLSQIIHGCDRHEIHNPRKHKMQT